MVIVHVFPQEAAMLIRGLYEVAIPVRRLPKAESFYRDVLGLEVGLRDDQRKWLFLRAGGAAGMVVLQENDGEFPRHHFAFTVSGSDLQQAATALRECGVSTRGPVFHDWMPGTSLYFEDPDGHELEFFAPATTRAVSET
jgi:lactoylglutathione lyase